MPRRRHGPTVVSYETIVKRPDRRAPLLRAALLCLCGLAAIPALAAPALAADSGGLAGRACAALAARVDEVPGSAPVFLRSYDAADGRGPAADPALTGAFTYDNALAVIALNACGHAAQARRVGEALLAAATGDRAGPRGRLRNVYRAGPQHERPPPPMGWWSVREGRWVEDAYHVGTATGNVAWAALALLTLAEATGDVRFRDGAARLADWTLRNARAPGGPGFTGGVHGHDDAPQPLTWASTEHNTDLAAVFGWLARLGVPGDWTVQARSAHAFLDRHWDEGGGRFWIGTTPDGAAPNRAVSGLDAQLWPLLLPDAPARWDRALAHAERAHGVEGGFDFSDDRDGLWVEGTAQAALVYRTRGRDGDAARLLTGIGAQFSPGGLLWATREPRITTGLAIGPDSTTDDFHYHRWPHVGATAWAALAAVGWNPFTGRRVHPRS